MVARWVRRLGFATAILAVIVGTALFGLAWNTARLREVPPGPVLGSLANGDAARGSYVAQWAGCSGCHAPDGSGQVITEIPYTARLVAPNLTEVRERYGDGDLQRLLRTGAKRDGQLALIMPSKAFQRLTDDEVADIIAWLRALPAIHNELPTTWIGPLAHIGVISGDYDVGSMHADAPESPGVLADRAVTDRGRHLALVACSECHGVDLAGFAPDGIPPLQIVKTYSTENFTRLLRTGVTQAGGESASGFMSAVARSRFSGLSEQDIGALKDYLDRY